MLSTFFHKISHKFIGHRVVTQLCKPYLPYTPHISMKQRYCQSAIDDDLGDRECMEFDAVIVGGGPSGLSAAIRLKQLAIENETDLQVCVIEKGAEIGSHIMSGNVFDTRALNELIPDWKARDAPIHQKVTRDELCWMTETNKYNFPFIPSMMHNSDNYIISLNDLCRWLAEYAEELQVDILPGFSASEALFNSNNEMIGVATSDVGLLKDGKPGPNFERGAEIRGRQTIIAEGCRGSIAEHLMKHYQLCADCDPQTYGIGFKEVWQLSENNALYEPGLVMHGLGYPSPLSFSTNMDNTFYSGSFIYHASDAQVFIGCVIGLEYSNPYLNPYQEFQKFKKHPKIAPLLADGECIAYGARAINEGGYQSVPKLSFPGGLLVGCSAGFVNVAKIKGTHYAMKSGMLAAENMFQILKNEIENETNTNDKKQTEISSYDKSVRDSWIMEDLYSTRNVKPSFNYGQIAGLMHSALTTTITKGKEPWTLNNSHRCADTTKPKSECSEIQYEKADGVISFDILTSVSRTATFHTENEPSHLKIKPELQHVADNDSYDIYGGPESRFCPAKVYEFVENSDGKMELVINSQNCIHCKTCSIKTPKEYIEWTVPQGGGGPKYAGM